MKATAWDTMPHCGMTLARVRNSFFAKEFSVIALSPSAVTASTPTRAPLIDLAHCIEILTILTCFHGDLRKASTPENPDSSIGFFAAPQPTADEPGRHLLRMPVSNHCGQVTCCRHCLFASHLIHVQFQILRHRFSNNHRLSQKVICQHSLSQKGRQVSTPERC